MFVKIQNSSVAHPGKLWTGDKPGNGVVAEIELVELHCECGATTRKLRVKNQLPVELADKAINVSQLPIVYISCGGVGSLHGSEEPLEAYNWSGRVGGSIIINPLVVLEGYVSTPPPTKEGYRWLSLYSGSTLNGDVLVRLGEDGKVHPEHLPPIRRVERAVECPPCREKRITAALKGAAEMYIIEVGLPQLRSTDGEEIPLHAVRAYSVAPTLEEAEKIEVSFLYEGDGSWGLKATGDLQSEWGLKVEIDKARISRLSWIVKSGERVDEADGEYVSQVEIAGTTIKVGQWFPDELIPKEADASSEPIPTINEVIILLANRAKDVSGKSDYALANSVFSFLLEKYFQEGEESGLKLELETNDSEGNSTLEAYYDIVVIRAGESSLCIPAPLLDSCSLLTAAKTAERVSRREHRRETVDNPTEMKNLWQELLKKVDGGSLKASLLHLSGWESIQIPEIISQEPSNEGVQETEDAPK